MLIDRLQVELTGPQIGRGVATHYALAGMDHQPDFKTFWAALASVMPSGVTSLVPASGDTIEVESGLLQSVWTADLFGSTTATNVGVHAAGVGACVNWITAGIANGHRVRGRTFIVPLAGEKYDSDGTLNAQCVSQINAACIALIGATSPNFGIYSRGVGDGDGTFHPVVSHKLADRVSTLRTRR